AGKSTRQAPYLVKRHSYLALGITSDEIRETTVLHRPFCESIVPTLYEWAPTSTLLNHKPLGSLL
ncbi:MAG TPA: hypothetical protein PL109_13430, partial [Nitrospira sp.]|nr:hypothetical protein [Nitrospira sp.]